MTGRWRPDPVAMHSYLTSPSGDVARDVQRRTRNIQLKARELVPKRTHELERNIITRVGIDGRGVVGRVIAGEQLPDARAVWMEQGTRPHTIVPKKPGGVLAFTVNGRRVFVRKVKHPGTKPYRYLLTALAEARR